MSYKAFVSSTFEDLKDHRVHVIRALRRAGFSVDPMEDWTADSDEPKQFSPERLEGCHLCVLLVAFRRGYIQDGESKSITQLEYEAAIKNGVDILVFMLNEDAPWPRKFDEINKDSGLEIWREDLGKSHGVEFFTTAPSSIDLTGTLVRWLTKKNVNQPEEPNIQPIEWPEEKSPYPGLEWLDADYSPLFFGREREIEELLAKMSEPDGRFILISGVSGSGKSSLVAAGLWQALVKEGGLPGSKDWFWLRITCGDGVGPFDSLAWGLKQLFPKISTKPVELVNELARDPSLLNTLLATHITQDQELLLFVDQLEELFTQGFKDEDIQQFLEHLITITRDSQNHLRLVSTIRSEFIGKLEGFETTLKVLNSGCNYHLGLVPPKMLQEMIEKPAKVTGYEFEASLVEKILEEVGKETGNLPLVAYTLKQLFEQRQGLTFTDAAYRAMGGVVGAIGAKADKIIKGLNDEMKFAFDRVFAELVHVDRDRPPTRKRVSLDRFKDDSGATALIQALASSGCRVLVTGGDKEEQTVEVAHEKLFTRWPYLEEWIKSNGEALRAIDYAEEAAKRWQEMGGHLQELWLARRAEDIQQDLNRFNKNASPMLERMLRPQNMLIDRLEDNTLSHEDRQLIGRKLAEFGDMRPGAGLRGDGLPDIVWIEIPGGKITLEGSNHVFTVKPFRLAKYPVTNRQFQSFIDDDGYTNDEWWQGIEKQELQRSSWEEPNVPREAVSWYEAVAFCRWLSKRMNSTIGLPTEWQSQQAATGGDPTFEYPWGMKWDITRCNSIECRLNRTTSVGIYPNGSTQHGVLDMAGNVWEWCLNKYYNIETEDSVLIGNLEGQRVVRGGSWGDGLETLSVSTRGWTGTYFRNNLLGFRLLQCTT